METLQSGTVKDGGFERQTIASAAKLGGSKPHEAKGATEVKEYDPRLVMELRHQVLSDSALSLVRRPMTSKNGYSQFKVRVLLLRK